jgi:protein pelota
MRILKSAIVSKNGQGHVKIQTDISEDMYYIYNLVCKDDCVTASTMRNVVKERSTGSTSKSRVRMTLKIIVDRIEFDAEQCSLRLNGRNIEENEYVKMGQYHTLDIEIGYPFSIEKKCWDSIYLQILKEATDPTKGAELAAIIMQDGLANVCLVTTSMTITKAKIECRLPKKKQSNQQYEKARSKFFDELYLAVLKYINFEFVKVVLVGSPGFVKDDFMTFLHKNAVKRDDLVIMKNKAKFVKAHASSGYRKSLDELLSNPDIQCQLTEVKAADEVKAFQKFYLTLSTDSDWAVYGFKDVQLSNEQLLIAELFVTDNLFKSSDFGLRRRYVALVESVKDNGGKVLIFSSMHISGEQLDLFTGVAAILRAPLPPYSDEDIHDINEIKVNIIKEIKKKSIKNDLMSSSSSDFSESESETSSIADI